MGNSFEKEKTTNSPGEKVKCGKWSLDLRTITTVEKMIYNWNRDLGQRSEKKMITMQSFVRKFFFVQESTGGIRQAIPKSGKK